MKLFWTGTDSLMLVDYSMRRFTKKPYWFVFRILVRIMEIFVEGHFCIAENIKENLERFGVKKPIWIVDTHLKHTKKYRKKKDEGFNIIYYSPKGGDRQFRRWLYGIDLIETVKSMVDGVNFIELDGSADMKEIYPIADFLLRPNRHDAVSRMRLECEIQDIPYYWTFKNPDLQDMLNSINNELNNR
jgi:hypothetical protein